jgi:hypothetical protein
VTARSGKTGCVIALEGISLERPLKV